MLPCKRRLVKWKSGLKMLENWQKILKISAAFSHSVNPNRAIIQVRCCFASTVCKAFHVTPSSEPRKYHIVEIVKNLLPLTFPLH